MRTLSHTFGLLAVCFSAVTARGADLTKIDRKIAKEPAYQNEPKYCLLVFGPEAKTRVWLVLDNDTLYVVYLPRGTTIADGGCDALSGYHFFGAAPDIQFEFIIPVPVSQTFAFAVIPTACADHNNPGATAEDIRDSITRAASHEILEAATDPLVGTGWINNTVVTLSRTAVPSAVTRISRIMIRNGDPLDRLADQIATYSNAPV